MTPPLAPHGPSPCLDAEIRPTWDSLRGWRWELAAAPRRTRAAEFYLSLPHFTEFHPSLNPYFAAFPQELQLPAGIWLAAPSRHAGSCSTPPALPAAAQPRTATTPHPTALSPPRSPRYLRPHIPSTPGRAGEPPSAAPPPASPAGTLRRAPLPFCARACRGAGRGRSLPRPRRHGRPRAAARRAAEREGPGRCRRSVPRCGVGRGWGRGRTRPLAVVGCGGS